MEPFVGCDAHKKYSVFVALDAAGELGAGARILHDRALFRQFLESLPAGSPIALEAGGAYYWMVDEMIAAATCFESIPSLPGARRSRVDR
ncbi:MAG: hypothetical protein AAB225_06395 [Acidobacteriota bacterium]